MKRLQGIVAAALVLGMARGVQAQQQPADTTALPALGSVAPDFTFRPITSAGIAAEPKKLSDYRGQTVVLWFFIKARTRG